MKELTLTAEIIFFETSKKYFNFPISNSIRSSFWIKDGVISTFAEIKIENSQIEVGELVIVKIILLERDFLYNKINIGTEFKIGVFPFEIAHGTIIDLKRD